MSSERSRSANNFGVWLVASSAAIIGGALFASSREKPAAIFALGFGLVVGIVLRVLADALTVPRNRRLILAAALLAAGGFVLSFVPSYRRAELDWERRRREVPRDPMAAAIINSIPDNVPPSADDPALAFGIGRYLQRRVPGWPSPWPHALFWSEWMACGLIAAVCVGSPSPFGAGPVPPRQNLDDAASG